MRKLLGYPRTPYCLTISGVPPNGVKEYPVPFMKGRTNRSWTRWPFTPRYMNLLLSIPLMAASMCGISALQGPQAGYQNDSRTTLPLKSSSLTFSGDVYESSANGVAGFDERATAARSSCLSCSLLLFSLRLYVSSAAPTSGSGVLD